MTIPEVTYLTSENSQTLHQNDKNDHFCLACEKHTKTIKAHLLPKSFTSETKIDQKKSEKHIIADASGDNKHISNTGIYDDSILCKKCDEILGNYEKEAFDLLRRLRLNHTVKKSSNILTEKSKCYNFKVKMPNNFIRFACGILWKYGSISPKKYGYINIDPCKEILKNICFNNADITEGIDVL